MTESRLGSYLSANAEELEERGIFGLPEFPIQIQTLRNLTAIGVYHDFEDFVFTESWYSPSGDPSGPPLRNLMSVLRHCPKTLVTITWSIGFDFLEVVGDDLKREMVDEYQELDRLCTGENFPSLSCFWIQFLLLDEDDHSSSPEQVGYPTEDVIEGCRTRLANALESLSKGGKLFTRALPV